LIGGDAVALTALAVAVAAGVALVAPAADVPSVDDWTYAWRVEHLLATGQLRVLDWSAHYPFAHVLWGAAIARVLGVDLDPRRGSPRSSWAGSARVLST